MTGVALQHQLQKGNTGQILEAINNAEALIGRQEISFPRIAVFGDESTGKSSLLEAICNVPFPRGDLVTTKCATQVRMQRTPGPWSASAWTDGVEGSPRRFETTVNSPTALTEVIRDLQKKEIERANKMNPNQPTEFSTVPITISIMAEDAVDLTLIDLPGYFLTKGFDEASDRRKAEMALRDVERVKTTLVDYLEDPNTILLVVVAANNNMKNANIFRLIEEYKKELDPDELENVKARTIYCFTKCDLVGTGPGKQRAPQDIEEVLSNKGDFAAMPHGWYAVICNLSGSNDPRIRLKLDRESETKYFDTQAPYNKPFLRNRCGTPKLVAKLSSVLSNEISKHVPTMLSETDNALTFAQRELTAMGPLPTQERNLSAEFIDVVDDIKECFENAMDGKHGKVEDILTDIAPDTKPETLKQCELGRLWKSRTRMFKEQIKSARMPLRDPAYQEELLEKIRASADGKLDDVLLRKEPVLHEVRRCAKRWRTHAERLCDDIANLAIRFLKIVVHVRAGQYEQLPGILLPYLIEMINEQKGQAHRRLRWHYVDEITRPNTMYDSFLNAYHKKPTSGTGGNDEGNRKTFTAILDALLPSVEARFVDNAVRTVTTHIMDVPLGQYMTRVELEEKPKYLFKSEMIRGDMKLEELMKLRGDLDANRKLVMSKICELEKLRNALLRQPTVRWDGMRGTHAENGTMGATGDDSEVSAASEEISDEGMEKDDILLRSIV